MKNFLRLFDFLFLCCLSVFIASCSTSLESTAYLSYDNGDGTYTNPVIQADYPDPDIIRVGEDYYMVSSSFVAMPGIPVCHSKDLVNWEIIGHHAFATYSGILSSASSTCPFDHASSYNRMLLYHLY